ncbi:adenylate/guanylate cyclase domain-containing protein [Roseibium sp. M-1]
MTSGGRFADATLGRKKLILLIALVAVSAGIAIGLSAKKAIWEGWFIDRLFQIRATFTANREMLPAPVVVVGLDQASLDSERLQTLPRVLMTPLLAKAGQAVLDAGALAVGYDFIFSYNADGFVDPNSGEARLNGYDTTFKRFLFSNRGKVFIASAQLGVPHRSFSGAAGDGGVRSVIVTPDSDGVVRRHDPAEVTGSTRHMIDALLEQSGATVPGEYLAIPYARLASSQPYFSFIDILEMSDTEEGREELKKQFDGKAVLFGGLLPTEDHHYYSDRFLPRIAPDLAATGVTGRPQYLTDYTAGVFMLADLAGAALTGRIAVEPPAGSLPALAVLFAVAGTLAGLLLPLTALLPVALLGAFVGLSVSFLGLEAGLLISPGVAPVACVSAMVVSAVGKISILQRRQRSLVRLFGHYLAPDVIRQMARSEQLPELGGDTRHVVVAFIDIVGFTKMSESLADRDVVRVVNSCFDAIGKVITKHQGYIDKYIGDAIMAVWNAPNTVKNPEQASVDAAVEIIGLLDHIRTITGQQPLDLRIALNAGPVLVGDIGGVHRRSFTVMGTTVNTASRIESVAKDKKVRLAVSQSVAEKLPGRYPKVEIWSGRLRGLSTDMAVYTLDRPELFMEDAERPGVTPAEQDRANLLKFPR